MRAKRNLSIIGALAMTLTGAAYNVQTASAQEWSTNGTDIYYNEGNVGIGTASPTDKLHVSGAIKHTNGLVSQGPNYASTWMTFGESVYGNSLILTGGGFTAIGGGESAKDAKNFIPISEESLFLGSDVADQSPAIRMVTGIQNGWNARVNAVTVTGVGNVGIGTATPFAKLDVNGTTGMVASFGTNSSVSDINYISSAGRAYFGYDGANARAVVQGIAGKGLEFNVNNGTFGEGTAMTISLGGYVGIGTTAPSKPLHVAGDVQIDGNIAAKYQDLAEWVPVHKSLDPGTVVIMDPEKPGYVVAASKPYDTKVAGVVSARPGIILGESGSGKVPIATTGRVKVKVDAGVSGIRIGDLLVTSTDGKAMKSEEIDIAGYKIHRPGTLLGKALEQLDAGTGEIMVLLSLQ